MLHVVIDSLFGDVIPGWERRARAVQVRGGRGAVRGARAQRGCQGGPRVRGVREAVPPEPLQVPAQKHP